MMTYKDWALSEMDKLEMVLLKTSKELRKECKDDDENGFDEGQSEQACHTMKALNAIYDTRHKIFHMENDMADAAMQSGCACASAGHEHAAHAAHMAKKNAALCASVRGK